MAELGADNKPVNGTVTFNGHTYTIHCDQATGKLTNTITDPKNASIAGTKVWVAAALDSADKTATIELYANGKATGITAEVTESSPAFSFTGLPVYALKGTEITVGTGEDAQTYAIPTADADGEAIEYTVKERGESNGKITLDDGDWFEVG